MADGLMITLFALLSFAQVILSQQQALPSLGCIKCASYNDGDCGLRSYNGQSPPVNIQNSCPAGTSYCYTLVHAAGGQQPYVRRGCGLVSCSSIGGNLNDACDENNQISIPSSGALNQSRTFSTNRQETSVLQYCQGQMCNAGLLANYQLPGYYVLQGGAALLSFTPKMLLIPFIFLVVSWL